MEMQKVELQEAMSQLVATENDLQEAIQAKDQEIARKVQCLCEGM